MLLKLLQQRIRGYLHYIISIVHYRLYKVVISIALQASEKSCAYYQKIPSIYIHDSNLRISRQLKTPLSGLRQWYLAKIRIGHHIPPCSYIYTDNRSSIQAACDPKFNPSEASLCNTSFLIHPAF